MTEFRHAPFFCEENAFHLVGEPDLGAGRRSVVFITNENRTVPMLCQRAAQDESAMVLWDYHVVILVEDAPEQPRIWDLDSTLGCPALGRVWIDHTFPWPDLPLEFRPQFRVVEGTQFRDHFSSDRSHMLDDEGIQRAPAPPWPRLGSGPSNLDAYLDLTNTAEHFGEVITATQLNTRVGWGVGP